MMVSYQPRIYNDSAATLLLQNRIDALSLGDNVVALDIMRILVDTNRATLAALKMAERVKAWSELGRAAHRLNGSLSMLESQGVVEYMRQLEKAALFGDAQVIDMLMPVVEESIDNLNKALEDLMRRVAAD